MPSEVLCESLWIFLHCGPTHGACLLIQKAFCVVYNYAGKADFSKGYLESKKRIGGDDASIFRR